MAGIWVGTSGYSYRHWKDGVFYPPGWPAAREFEYYARHFPTVEINNSFYQLPPRERFESWRGRAPAGFRFAVKASRFITHIKKLKDCGPPLRLLEDRLGGLGTTLGPVLLQLPPRWRPDLARLDAFLPLLPRHWEVAMEFRHPDWWTPAVLPALRQRLESAGVALCWAVSPETPDPPRPVTAGFVYIRLHGGLAGDGNFGEAELRKWARRIAPLASAYIYFNNDGHAFAIRNAQRIRQLLGLEQKAA